MTYPVNVGRNIARETANSHYIFPSDIELYPSPGLIPSILKMVTSREEEALKRPNPRVFVSSIFEIKEGHDLPETKAELVKLLKSKVVIPFHKMVCSQCHAIPKAQEWVTDPISGRIFDFFDDETAKLPCQHDCAFLNFGHSEKHKEFDKKIFRLYLTLLSNIKYIKYKWKIFSNFWSLLRISKL